MPHQRHPVSWCSSMRYYLLSIWLSMHASVAAHAFGVRPCLSFLGYLSSLSYLSYLSYLSSAFGARPCQSALTSRFTHTGGAFAYPRWCHVGQEPLQSAAIWREQGTLGPGVWKKRPCGEKLVLKKLQVPIAYHHVSKPWTRSGLCSAI